MTKKILIIRFSSIGDIVLTTPVIRCLFEQMPDIEIHYVTKKEYVSLISASPYLKKIHALDKSLGTLIQQLKKEHFDFVIDLHHNLRSQIIKASLQGQKFSFKKINFQKWLMVQFKINKLPNVHLVDRYLQTTISLGIKNDYKGLDFFIEDGVAQSVSQITHFLDDGFVALIIGAKHNTKKLPVKKLIELTTKIEQKIILIGGKEDAEIAAQIQQTDPQKIFNGCGIFSLQQSAYLIQQASKVCAHDTGMMHIAAALKKEIISFWGNTIPEFGMYPYDGSTLLPELKLKNKIFEVQNLSCRPCSKIGYDRCPRGHFKCMLDIDFENFSA